MLTYACVRGIYFHMQLASQDSFVYLFYKQSAHCHARISIVIRTYNKEIRGVKWFLLLFIICHITYIHISAHLSKLIHTHSFIHIYQAYILFAHHHYNTTFISLHSYKQTNKHLYVYFVLFHFISIQFLFFVAWISSFSLLSLGLWRLDSHSIV